MKMIPSDLVDENVGIMKITMHYKNKKCEEEIIIEQSKKSLDYILLRHHEKRETLEMIESCEEYFYYMESLYILSRKINEFFIGEILFAFIIIFIMYK